ncbi:MAG: uroporphyrinogen-III C-methyltransferase [Gammaproteobacteria bacterium]|nr:uroporphyrinogen-III C-methyltransferase [Gammaproteobacteria bacterium]
MDYLPVFFKLAGKRCLVVGGGEVAARKAELLLRAGATLEVVAPTAGPALDALCDRYGQRIRHTVREFLPSDLDDCGLAVAATDDEAVNREVSAQAQARAVPVNVVDRPELCSFIVPSIIDRSPVLVAVSTGGASPVLARLIRARLEALIPAGFGRLATIAHTFRERVKERIAEPNARRAFWERVLTGPIAEMVFAGRERAAHEALASALEQGPEERGPVGEVYLVGAGPGDPDLLTNRALRLMQQADVIVYDRLVSAGVLDLARRDARRIYAGKERDRHVLPQEDINDLLVRLAREGQRVVRLKGGDPFIFGRGGEEIETLAEQGIPFQIVPGITAASGCAAYAGIPLTHRDHAQACVFVTGHLKDGTVNLDWEFLVRPHQTVVIYMGLVGLPTVCRELVRHGMPAATPAALVEQGTTRAQRVFTGTLQTLPELVRAGGARAPTLIIVGEVVKLHRNLAWFEPAGDVTQDVPPNVAEPRRTESA